MKSIGPQSPVLIPLVGARTPSETPSQPIVYERDPLGLLDPPRMPSPPTANIIGQRWKTEKEYRPTTPNWKEAGLLPGARPVDIAQEFDCYGRRMPRPSCTAHHNTL